MFKDGFKFRAEDEMRGPKSLWNAHSTRGIKIPLDQWKGSFRFANDQ